LAEQVFGKITNTKDLSRLAFTATPLLQGLGTLYGGSLMQRKISAYGTDKTGDDFSYRASSFYVSQILPLAEGQFKTVMKALE
jgi:hypothetical protein